MNDCPPCNNDCNQGRDCPARKSSSAEMRRNTLQMIIDMNQKCIEQLRVDAERIGRKPPWLVGAIARHRDAINHCLTSIEMIDKDSRQ